jgi:AcrR family transcriptional regulator
MPKLSDEAKQERIAHVLAGARRCFARFGYEGATVARLEQEIGLSRGAIFNWFPSKEDLFFALAAQDSERFLEIYAEEGFAALVHRMVGEDADWLAVYLEFARLLRTDAALRERWQTRSSDELSARARERVVADQLEGRIRDDIGIDDAMRFLGLVLDGLAMHRAFGFDPLPSELVVELTEAALRTPR